MSNKFCRLLSNGYKINVSGEDLLWSPCCFYSKKTPLLDAEAFKKELEYTSSATTWLPECSTCQQMESTGVRGLMPRLHSFIRVPEEYNAGECVALEISFDRKCNAACLSCGSYCSTTWTKYEQKHQLISHTYDQNPANLLLDKLLSAVKLDKVRDIFIMGGEPLYSDTNLKLLTHLRDNHSDLSTIRLRYQTNGSVAPTAEVLNLLTMFGSVDFSLSIDGVADRFDYLRWPLKWHRVERNVNNLLDTTSIKFSINATISPLNVLYFQEIDDWILKTIPTDRLTWPDRLARPNRCFAPLDLNYTSPQLREKVIQLYGDNHPISKIFNGLNFNPDYKSMFDYINKHDQLRRLNWKEVFPEVVKYYQ